MKTNGEWAIQPFQSVGPLHFEMERSEVHRVFEEPPREFKKGSSENVTESYDQAGVHVYYDSSGAVEFIEAFPPANPVYEGIDLMRTDTQAVLADLAGLGLQPRDDGEGGLWFDDRGFVLYAPGGETEGVSAFRHGYPTGA
jgi:hypothetical protein